MRKILIFFFLFFCASSFTKAQTVRMPVTAIYTQLNTYSVHHADAFSFGLNQAALAQIKNFSAGVYGEKRFLLQDLGLYKAAVALPTSSGNFGFNANYFGSSLYNESQIGLAYARKLGKADVGVQFNYYQFKTSGYGNAAAINFEAGAIFHINEKLRTGVHLYNPMGAKIGKNENEKLPTIFSAGFGYDASDKFFIGTEIEKVEDQSINVNAGMQYAFAEKLFARAGISSATSSFYFGVGFMLNGFRIDATASLHQYLGITPGLMLVYNSSK